MNNKLHNNNIINLLLPCIAFSALTGFFSAIIITAFKIAAEWVIHLSGTIYSAVRANPIWLPLLVIGAAALGIVVSIILAISHSCKGGGIPTSVAAIRGVLSFTWFKSILLLPVSALTTFLVGLPLGTEGPCVQMGTAVGDGVVKCIGGDKHRGWRRYIMSGGASAGFSIATASPISAIIFAMEEIHKRFSPILLSVASVAVMTAQITDRALAAIGIGDVKFLDVPEMTALTPELFFTPLLIGIVCGVCSILFTRLYHLVDHLMRFALKKLSARVILPLLFALTAIVGFFFADALGTGHSLVTSLFTEGAAWYALILLFLIRSIGMIISNTSGATGGIFLPTLAFGAILGAMCAEIMIALGLIGHEHYAVMVMLGVTAFLGSTSRIPLTACVFAIEALGGIENVLPLVIATTASLLIVEASGLEDFTDTVIEAKMHRLVKGKKALSLEIPLTVAGDSFAVGKELSDVLWPGSCVVVSFKRARTIEGHLGLSEGDVITVHYVTYDPEATSEELCALVGEQSPEVLRLMTPEV